MDVRGGGGRYGFALRARGAVRQALHEEPYDVVVEDINKLPLYTPTLTSLPICVIVPHLFGTTAFREASWPVATLVWLAELPIPAVYRRAAFHAIGDRPRDELGRPDLGVPDHDHVRVVADDADRILHLLTFDLRREGARGYARGFYVPEALTVWTSPVRGAS